MKDIRDLKGLALAAIVPVGLLVLSLALSACGGSSPGSATSSGASASTGSPASSATASTASTALAAKEVASGTVTGFGSTLIEGRKYEDSSASVLVEDDPASPRSGTTSDIRLGAQVVTKSSGTTASSILVRSELVGTVASLASDSFVVAGVTVKVSADTANPTVFDGLSGLADLAVGDFVEIHGQRDAGNNLIATRIERRDPSSTLFTKVSGVISGLDTTARTFTMGGLSVSYASATKVLPGTSALVNGARVAVFSTTAIAANVLSAQSVVVRGTAASTGDTVRVGGRVSALDTTAKTMVIDGVTTDFSSATYTGGALADLANGLKLRVAGTFVNSTLVASEVSFVKKPADAVVDLTGSITDFVSSSSFRVRGVSVDASGSSIAWTHGDASNLGNFVVVRIRGAVASDIVTPTSVEFLTSSADVNRAFVGVVANYNSATGSFTLMNVAMKLLGTTTFSNADGTVAGKPDFATGDSVAVKGSLVGGVFEVSSVMFRNGTAPPASSVEGLVGGVDIAHGKFRLNGHDMVLGSGARIDGSLGSLRNGAMAQVLKSVVTWSMASWWSTAWRSRVRVHRKPARCAARSIPSSPAPGSRLATRPLTPAQPGFRAARSAIWAMATLLKSAARWSTASSKPRW